MLIISTDGILADAIEVMLKEAGMTDIKKRTNVPASSHEPALIDIDTVSGRHPGAVITVSADRTRGADLLRPFSEKQLAAVIYPFLNKPEGKESASADAAREEKSALPEITEGGMIYRKRFIPLSPAEHRLAALLLDSPGQPVGSDRLIEAIGEGGSGNSLRVYIRFLREKLDFAFSERLIYTVRGKGYMIAASPVGSS